MNNKLKKYYQLYIRRTKLFNFFSDIYSKGLCSGFVSAQKYEDWTYYPGRFYLDTINKISHGGDSQWELNH